MNVEAAITQYYPYWLEKAKGICRTCDPNDLVQFTLTQFLEKKDTSNIRNIRAYINRAMYLQGRSPESPFSKQNHTGYVEIKEHMAAHTPSPGARLDGETLDARISRLKPEDAELLREYARDDFNFEAYARKIGVQKITIYRRLRTIKDEIRGLLTKKPDADIQFEDDGLFMLADIEGKCLYVAGKGSTEKECRMISRVGQTLRENHKVKDFDKWSTFHCLTTDPLFQRNVTKKKKESFES